MSDDVLAQMERDHQEFLRRIEHAAEQDITGLVGADGAAGVKGRSGPWDLVIHLAAWKDPAGAIHREGMRVEIPVSEEALRPQMDAIKAYSILGLRLRIAEHPSGRTQGRGSVIPVTGVQDAALSRIASELRKPVVISDPVLGDFTLDRAVGWFRGKTAWGGNQVELDLSANEHAEAERCLEVARALWNDQSAWSAKIADYAAAQLLELKNESWLDEGEPPATPDAFKSRMSLESVLVYPDGAFDFWHDDGDLFWGHAIMVSGSLAKGPTDVEISG